MEVAATIKKNIPFIKGVATDMSQIDIFLSKRAAAQLHTISKSLLQCRYPSKRGPAACLSL